MIIEDKEWSLLIADQLHFHTTYHVVAMRESIELELITFQKLIRLLFSSV